jgi:hypothetical protein
MKVYSEIEIQLHTSSVCDLVEIYWPVSRSGSFTQEGALLYQLHWNLGGPQRRFASCGGEKYILPFAKCNPESSVVKKT